MSASKKIFFVLPSLQQGGLENHATILINGIAKERNFEVGVICVYQKERFYDVDDNVEVFSPKFKREGISTMRYYYKFLRFANSVLAKNKPDVIVSFGDYINFLSIIVAKFNSVPVFVGDRSSPGKPFPVVVSKLRNWTYPRASGIIAQTTRAREQKMGMVGDSVPIRIIPNAIKDLQFFNEEKRNIILCVARHYHVKGIDRLLEAFAKAKSSNWNLEIAGSYGPETENLKDQAKRLGIETRVKFLGARKDIDKVYSYSGVFVLPSRSEGLPNALIEAMAHGLPCISFDINAGPSDVIQHEVNGFLVEDGNINELARRMDDLMQSEEKREVLGKNATAIREKLSKESVVRMLLDFIVD